MTTLLAALLAFLRGLVRHRAALALENAALRQQLTVFQRQGKRPSLEPCDRIFWAVLRTIWSEWTRPLFMVKPATVIGWCNKGIRALGRHKSKPAARGFQGGTSTSSGASLPTIPSGVRTRLLRSSLPSLESTIPAALSGDTWSRVRNRHVVARVGGHS